VTSLLVGVVVSRPGNHRDRDARISRRSDRPPSLTAEETGRVDAVLLQHDQHPDNPDRAGCAYLATCRWP
jgi:hypothetical protein